MATRDLIEARFCSLLVVLLLVATACGGDDGPGGHGVEGPYARVSGARAQTFSLAPGTLQVVCKPKPGLQEFEYEAATVLGSETGTYLRFTLADYTGPKEYLLEYEIAKAKHKIAVGLPAPEGGGKDYRYTFFQHLRPDLNEVYRSRCRISLAAEEGTTKTRFTGMLSCSMLFADYNSRDNNSSGLLNAFVDLWAKLECDY
jgi:hypothetical protein